MGECITPPAPPHPPKKNAKRGLHNYASVQNIFKV